jgi:hypothetical protein
MKPPLIQSVTSRSGVLLINTSNYQIRPLLESDWEDGRVVKAADLSHVIG